MALAFDAAMPGVRWLSRRCCAVFLFGYTTLIGWAYYGEQFLEYIFGPRRGDAVPVDLLPADPVRRDHESRARLGRGATSMNALQVFPNIIGVLGLSGLVAKVASEK